LLIRHPLSSQQPWSSYALHIATFTSLAFLVDPLLLATCWWGTAGSGDETRRWALLAQLIFMFGFTKVVKLVGLFLRNPADVKFLPASILFGYFHGLIKLYALATLNMVSTRSFRAMLRSPRVPDHPTDTSSRRHPGAVEPMAMPTTTTDSRPVRSAAQASACRRAVIPTSSGTTESGERRCLPRTTKNRF
jgi:hypothetical protein